MSSPQHRLPEYLSFRRMIPNMLTLMALAAGVSALRFALMGDYEKTIIAMMAACLFDVLDGGVARLLGTPSKFGAELDSLSDVICFGLTPAITLYIWVLQEAGTLGWLATLCFVLCCALRLARFNVMTDSPAPNPLAKKFFTGSPAPGTAGLALLPLIATLQWPDSALREQGTFIAFWLITLSLLMVSRVPTFALKGWPMPRAYALPALMIFGLILAGLVSDTWMTLLLVGTIYVLSLPLSFWLHIKLSKKI